MNNYLKKYDRFNWVVEKDTTNPLWDDFIKWLNEKSEHIKFNGRKKRFYGFTGSMKGYNSLMDAPKDTQVLSLEDWTVISNNDPLGGAAVEPLDKNKSYYVPLDTFEKIKYVYEDLKTISCNLSAEKAEKWRDGDVFVMGIDKGRIFYRTELPPSSFKTAGYKKTTLREVSNVLNILRPL